MIDVGASKLVVEGKIKLKNDSVIKRYTKTGFEFEDGSTVDADVILFATGCVSVYLRLSVSCLPPLFPPLHLPCPSTVQPPNSVIIYRRRRELH